MTQTPVRPAPARLPAPAPAPGAAGVPAGRGRIVPARWRRVRLVRGRSVTGRIYLLAGVTLAALALLFTALAAGAVSARDGLRVIGHTDGPQVMATANLYFALSDMDAQVAGVLLVNEESPSLRQWSLDRYERRRGEAAAALLRASELAGGDPVEQRTIRDMLEKLGRYEQLAGRALLLGEQADYPGGTPPPEVLATYQEATDLMSRELLPQAYNLTLESGTIVRETHDATRSAVITGRRVVAAGGVLAVACLVALQLYLAYRFHRRVSPALLVATAVTAMYAFTGVSVLGKGAAALDAAKEEGFDTVLSLARARAISNSMYADQNRWLLDPDRADRYEQVYFDKAQSLLYLEAGNLAEYGARLPAVSQTYHEDGGIPGLLGTESGIPQLVVGHAGGATAAVGDPPLETRWLELPGQDEPVSFAAVGNVLDSFGWFQMGDQELRALSADDRTGLAMVKQVGRLGARSQYYDSALVWLTGLFRVNFDRAVGAGEDALDGMEFLLPVAMLTIAVLMAAGLVPRLREYR